MPSYTFQCKKCKSIFNTMTSIEKKEKKEIKCPECGNKELSQQFKSISVSKGMKERPVDCSQGCGSCPNRLN